jgi:hypothetical protein
VQNTFFIKRRDNKVIQDRTSYPRRRIKSNKATTKEELQRPQRPDAEEVSNQEEVSACPNLGFCRAYTPGTHTRKDEDILLVEFPCNPTRTCSV